MNYSFLLIVVAAVVVLGLRALFLLFVLLLSFVSNHSCDALRELLLDPFFGVRWLTSESVCPRPCGPWAWIYDPLQVRFELFLVLLLAPGEFFPGSRFVSYHRKLRTSKFPPGGISAIIPKESCYIIFQIRSWLEIDVFLVNVVNQN